MSNSNTDQAWNSGPVWNFQTKIFHLWMDVATGQYQWMDENLVPYGPRHPTRQAAEEWANLPGSFRPLTDR